MRYINKLHKTPGPAILRCRGEERGDTRPKLSLEAKDPDAFPGRQTASYLAIANSGSSLA